MSEAERKHKRRGETRRKKRPQGVITRDHPAFEEAVEAITEMNLGLAWDHFEAEREQKKTGAG